MRQDGLLVWLKRFGAGLEGTMLGRRQADMPSKSAELSGREVEILLSRLPGVYE